MGIASATYKEGRYSKVIPTQLMEVYRRAQEDPNRLSIEGDIELLDTLLLGALDSMNRGDPGELWEKLHESAQAYKRAKRRPKEGDDPQEHLSLVLWLIEEGYHDYMARIEIRQMIQERARLVEAEGKRIERAQASVNAAQFTQIIIQMAEAVARHVDDDRAVQAITGEFYALVGAGAGAVRAEDS